jgi:serine/threonine protein kinase
MFCDPKALVRRLLLPLGMRDGAVSAAVQGSVGLARGERVGRYVIRALVGRGAMGEVYRAFDPSLGRRVAIKVVRPRLQWGSGAAKARSGLLREARAMARICDPHVLAIYDLGVFDDGIFIAMEFIEGKTITSWLRAQPRSWQEVLHVFSRAGRGLAAAHAKQLVHHDFKPDNVMIGDDGYVRVMDFGLALELRRGVCRETGEIQAVDLTATNVVSALGQKGVARPTPPTQWPGPHVRNMRGTPEYMSAEQFLGQRTDARTDQFSFCVALFEALYGVRPFEGRSLAELRARVFVGKVVTPRDARSIPPALVRVLARGLSPNPALRWPSMDALLNELQKAAAHPHSFPDRVLAFVRDVTGA